MKELLKFMSPNRKQKSPLDSGPPHYSNPVQFTDPSYVNQGHHQLSLGYQTNPPQYNPLHNQTVYNPATLPHFSQQQQQPAVHIHSHPHQHHHQLAQHQQQPIQSCSTCTCCSPPNAATNLQSPPQAMTTSYSVNNFSHQCRDSTLQDPNVQMPYENPAVAAANATGAANPQTIQYQNFNTQSTNFPTAGPATNYVLPTNGVQQPPSRSCEQQSFYSNQIPVMAPQQQQYQNQRSLQPSIIQQQLQQAELRSNSTNNQIPTGQQQQRDAQKYRQVQQQQQQQQQSYQQQQQQQQHQQQHTRMDHQHTQIHQVTNEMKQLKIQQQQQYQNHDELNNHHNEELPLEPAYLIYERDYDELNKTASALRVDIKQLGKELDAIRKRHPYEVFMDMI